MKEILSQALKRCEAAEVVVFDTYADVYQVFNFQSNEVLTKRYQEVCLRVVQDGRIGMAHGTYKGDHAALIDNALRSAAFGGEADFAFAPKAPFETPEIHDPELAEMDVAVMARDAKDIIDYVRKKAPEMMMNVYLECERRKVSLVNSAGFDASYDQTIYTTCLIHVFPGDKEGIIREDMGCRYRKVPREHLDDLIADFNATRAQVSVPTRPMPVIFKPSATWSLLWRLLVGVNGENVVHGVTPLAEKMNQAIFPECITAIDDPTRPWGPGSMPFDDEGVPTKRKPIVEKGVLKNFIFDLRSGTKSGKGSTGNAFKRDMWSRGISVAPTPRFTNLVLSPGTMPVEAMIRDAGECLVINDVIGFHSGNMLQGEFSMGVGIGAYYKDGKSQGRVMDTMVSGNLYKDSWNLKALGDKSEYNSVALSPAFYFSTLNVSGSGS